MEPKSRLGVEIRKRREARSWSQAHLAEAADLDPRTVRRIERGETTPSKETLLDLCSALQIDAETLLQETRDQPRPKTQVIPIDNGRDLLNALAGAHAYSVSTDETDDEETAEVVKQILDAIEFAEILPEIGPRERYDAERDFTAAIAELSLRGWSVGVRRHVETLKGVPSAGGSSKRIDVPHWVTVTLCIWQALPGDRRRP